VAANDGLRTAERLEPLGAQHAVAGARAGRLPELGHHQLQERGLDEPTILAGLKAGDTTGDRTDDVLDLTSAMM
jgi:hypothetical protein